MLIFKQKPKRNIKRKYKTETHHKGVWTPPLAAKKKMPNISKLLCFEHKTQNNGNTMCSDSFFRAKYKKKIHKKKWKTAMKILCCIIIIFAYFTFIMTFIFFEDNERNKQIYISEQKFQNWFLVSFFFVLFFIFIFTFISVNHLK